MQKNQPGQELFLEEARELLEELQTSLLEIEENPGDRELIDRAFRALHTIKGSGSMFGFDALADFTHEVESVFDLVRSNEMRVSTELLTLTLAAGDHIRSLLEKPELDQPTTQEGRKILARLALLNPRQSEGAPASSSEGEVRAAQYAKYRIFRIRFAPEQSIFLRGVNPVHLLDELRELGRTTVLANLDLVPGLEELDPEQCYISWDIILETDRDEHSLRDVFIFVEDDCRLDITLVDSDVPEDSRTSAKRLGEILVDRGDITLGEIEEALARQKRLGSLLKESGKVGPSRIASALAEQEVVRESRRTGQRAGPAGTSIRVGADRLDALVNLVGELVIVQAQISQVVQTRRDPLLTGLAEELERLSGELRDSALNMRMVPFGSSFSTYKRLVRDLSMELGKEIDLVTSGAGTELDKTVIDKLKDPLVHLLRNSMDHGVEHPEVRTAHGKPARGTIRLSAEQAGGYVVIRIQDDGAGLDAEGIRNKAVEKGLLSSEMPKSDQELFEYIFQPGFSTAGSVTSLSGRGVGMDVVKRSIEALGGSVGIESSKGRGTTVTVKIPLTLAIIEGLQVQVGEESFVLPLSSVEECVEISGGEKGDRRLVELRGDLVPYVRLRECFEVPGTPPVIEQVVVTGSNGKRLGIVVDQVIGEHQTVIKPLGRLYANVPGVSGATIKGDGSMALILDVPTIMAGQESRT